MKVQIFGKTYSMGGLTGVGTYPEYTNMGLMHRLLEQALENMRKRNSISAIFILIPFPITDEKAGS